MEQIRLFGTDSFVWDRFLSNNPDGIEPLAQQ